MIYDVVLEGDPILEHVADKFDFFNPPIDPKELFDNMKETLLDQRGLGLSANQCGLPYSMFVFGNPDEPDSISGMYNPQIVEYNGDKYYEEEGCLSFPGWFIRIPRSQGVRVRFTSWNGETGSRQLEGLESRVFQHEFDHLLGITFKKRAKASDLTKARKQKTKLDRIRKRVKNEQTKEDRST
jgi:peptide deformylase